MELLFSIIIPACDAEQYLERAVESIVHNKEKNYEIIIVENGSVDNTLQIAYKLEKKYSCIRVYQSLKGVSNARNMGIEKSVGKWICFMDEDDKAAPNLIKKYINATKESLAQLIIFSYKKNDHQIGLQRNIKAKEQIICRVLESPTRFSAVWAKLFDREFLEKFKIKFDPDLVLSEDSVFLLEYMLKAEKIEINSECVYEYCLHCDSVTRKFDGTKETSYIKALESIKDIIEKEGEWINKSYNVYTTMQLNLIMVKEVFARENRLGFWKRIAYLKQVSNRTIFQRAIQNIRLRECKSVGMIPILFIKLHFYLGAATIYYLRVISNRRGALK